MNALKNKVQLIGYVGNDPEVSELKSGKKKKKGEVFYGHQ